MARAKETSNKKDRTKAMIKKRKEKEQRKEERKANSGKGKGTDNMFAYVDAYGNIVSTPPDPRERKEINTEDIQISVSRRSDEDKTEPRLNTGTVSFFNDSKGYGFIKDDETGAGIFVHMSDLKDHIRENDKVSFETVKGPKGLNAVKVKIIKE